MKYSLAIVAVTALFTLLTRALPFLIFGTKGRELPSSIRFIGSVLPSSVMIILVIYSIKDISFLSLGGWVYEVVAMGVTIATHLLKRNTLVSIIVGTITYMLLVQHVVL
ncbi:MAG: branched-chain amino acid transporter permease [Sphaerochaetaceae bacterium]|jgi:branched-subunit amino acid transport protein AzlD